MTDTVEPTTAPGAPEEKAGKKRSGGLSTMLLADLKSMAGGLGIPGAGSMKKAQLVEAIKAHQAGAGNRPQREQQPREEQPREEQPREEQRPDQAKQQGQDKQAQHKQAQDKQGQEKQGQQKQKQQQKQDQHDQQRRDQQKQDQQRRDQQRQDQQRRDQQRQDQQKQDQRQEQSRQDEHGPDQAGPEEVGEDGQGSRRNRRRRGRDRDRAGSGREPDTTILEDDVLVPAAGILDVLDNYAFVRTSGYLPGADDVYVSLSMVRKYGLRRGDAIVGQVRQPREGERKEKFNPMVRIDSVNGADPEAAKNRAEFSQLVPLYPSERLRLETTPDNLVGRVIDIAAPVGKGQRGLIVSPAQAGKTTVLQSIAASIATNNPEVHLMVVLVDERPEDVTDFQRSVKGEVIASTFDRPASDHTMVAELAIERAKRLVELGHDVVVLLDGITRLGRAYNLSLPASGRVLSGGVDPAALYPPKKFFGAARNIEDGGSLTILATAQVESGSPIDEVILEEVKGTGNLEIRLRRDLADKRLFPAIDAVQSGTRRAELLLGSEELAVVWRLKETLSDLDGQAALEALLERMRRTQTNIELLMQVQRSAPGRSRED